MSRYHFGRLLIVKSISQICLKSSCCICRLFAHVHRTGTSRCRRCCIHLSCRWFSSIAKIRYDQCRLVVLHFICDSSVLTPFDVFRLWQSNDWNWLSLDRFACWRTNAFRFSAFHDAAFAVAAFCAVARWCYGNFENVRKLSSILS